MGRRGMRANRKITPGPRASIKLKAIAEALMFSEPFCTPFTKNQNAS